MAEKARIVILIEDQEDGNVTIVANPSFEQIAQMINSGHPSTAAHGYAVAMMNEARRISKAQDKLKILIPRIGR